jgi:hypothetical protein
VSSLRMTGGHVGRRGEEVALAMRRPAPEGAGAAATSLDQPCLVGEDHCLNAVADLELGKDP